MYRTLKYYGPVYFLFSPVILVSNLQYVFLKLDLNSSHTQNSFETHIYINTVQRGRAQCQFSLSHGYTGTILSHLGDVCVEFWGAFRALKTLYINIDPWFTLYPAKPFKPSKAITLFKIMHFMIYLYLI